MKRDDNGLVSLDSEALEGLSGLRPDAKAHDLFNQEDLDHLEDLIFDFQHSTGALSLPGAEAVYAKIHLALEGRLPDEVQDG